MEDIELVIKIPEEVYKAWQIINAKCKYDIQMPLETITNGTPLPKGHGDLIDRDAIPEQIKLKGFLSQDNMCLVTIDRVKEVLKNTPTIIEADKAESEG